MDTLVVHLDLTHPELLRIVLPLPGVAHVELQARLPTIWDISEGPCQLQGSY